MYVACLPHREHRGIKVENVLILWKEESPPHLAALSALATSSQTAQCFAKARAVGEAQSSCQHLGSYYFLTIPIALLKCDRYVYDIWKL